MQTCLDSWIIALNSSNAILLNRTHKSWFKFNFTGLMKDKDDICYIEKMHTPVSSYIFNYTNNIYLIY